MSQLLIKKYGNRRLYDTLESRYLTLEELAHYVRRGVDVRVVDAQTNEDLTQQTLVQIVLETGHASKFLPNELLVQMVRLSDDALAEFFSRYVVAALDVYLRIRRGAEQLATYNPFAGMPLAAGDALARLWVGNNMNPGFQGPSPYAGGYAPPSPYVAPPPPPEQPEARGRPPSENGAPSDEREDVAAMRRELEELKQAVLGKKRGRRKGT